MRQMNENDYSDSRAEELLDRRGLTRRDLVKLGAALPRCVRDRPARHTHLDGAGGGGRERLTRSRRRLPPEWFVNFGTNAEMRWDSVGGVGYTTPNDRFFVRDHTATPIIDVRDLVSHDLRHGLEGVAGLVHARPAPGPAPEGDRVVHRVRRQRSLLLRFPAGHARDGNAVGPRGDRRRPLARRPSLRDPRPSRAHRGRSRRDAVRPRRQRRHRRDRLWEGSPPDSRREGARQRARRPGDERPAAAGRPRLPRPAHRPRLDQASPTSSGSGRSRSRGNRCSRSGTPSSM